MILHNQSNWQWDKHAYCPVNTNIEQCNSSLSWKLTWWAEIWCLFLFFFFNLKEFQKNHVVIFHFERCNPTFKFAGSRQKDANQNGISRLFVRLAYISFGQKVMADDITLLSIWKNGTHSHVTCFIGFHVFRQLLES